MLWMHSYNSLRPLNTKSIDGRVVVQNARYIRYTVYARGPTMVGPQGKFSSSGSPDAWKMLLLDRFLLNVECKIKGAL